MCPGTLRGSYEPGRHVLQNHTVEQVRLDLTKVLAMARGINPRLRTVLTVSPVPLTATATGRHALVATTYSKSVLRAAAGQIADSSKDIDYFPSYEIVTGFPYRAAFFEQNLRTVTPDGVAFVMRHFFRALQSHPDPAPPFQSPTATATAGEDHWCDDAVLDYYNPVATLPASR
jgi:hypothetical protein